MESVDVFKMFSLLSAEDVSDAISDGMTLVIDHNSDASFILCDNLYLLCRCFHFFPFFRYYVSVCVFNLLLWLLLLLCFFVLFYVFVKIKVFFYVSNLIF